MRRPLGVLLLAVLAGTGSRAEEGAEQRFTWRPSFETRTEYDDNAFLREHQKNGDVGVWMVPGLDLAYRTPALDLGADFGAEIPRYFDHSSLDDSYWRLNAHGEVGLWPGLSVRVSDAFTPQPKLLGAPEDSPSNLTQSNRAGAEVRYWRELASGRELTLGITGARFDSDNFDAYVPGPGGTTVYDSNYNARFTEGGGYAELRNPIGEHHAIVVSSRVQYRDFDSRTEGGHLEAGGLLGLESQLPGSVDLDVAGGFGWLDPNESSGQPHALGRLDLTWRPGEGLSVRLGVHHEMTQDILANDFMDTTGRLTIEKFFGLRTSASVTAFVSQLESDSTHPKSDLFGGAEVVLRRQLSRSFQVALSYRYWENAGGFALDDFRQNRVQFTLSYRR
jgi:hypothetical protein